MPTIFITGAGRGIGFHLATLAQQAGWRVAGSVRTNAAAEMLQAALPRAEIFSFDVTDHKRVEAAADGFAGPLDVLVNNAGIIGPARQSTLEMDFDGFAETLAVNTMAPLKIAQAFLPHLKTAANPRIVNISSQMGSMANAGTDRIAYRASKAALNKISQGLAADLAPLGIAVVAIHPGWVRTDMGGSAANIAPEQSAAGILSLIEKLSLAGTGKFFDWDGSQREW